MANIIVDIEDAVERFGEWVAKEFSAAETVYNDLTEDEQKAATWGYGLIAVVNDNLDKDASVIVPIIQLKYPDLSLDVIHGFVDTVLNDIKAVQSDVPITLEDALNALVSYLKGFKGSTWEQISQALGNLLAIAFSPTTPIQKFISVAEMVYQLLVKPHVQA